MRKKCKVISMNTNHSNCRNVRFIAAVWMRHNVAAIEHFDFPKKFIHPRFVLLNNQYRSLYNKYKPWMNK